jgi:hypothetical protein
MIVAIVNQSVPAGQVKISAFIEAASAVAGRDAYVAGFTPPLPAADWLGVDTGWAKFTYPAAGNTWAYDFGTSSLVAILNSAALQESIKAELLADPLNGLLVTAVAAGLVITTNIEGLVVNDITTVVADLLLTKYVRVSYVYHEDSDTFSVEAFEKTDGEYALYDPPDYLVRELGEWYVVANGTNLVQV